MLSDRDYLTFDSYLIWKSDSKVKISKKLLRNYLNLLSCWFDSA